MKKLGTAICLSSALLLSTAVQADWQGNWLVGLSGGYAEREGKDYITIIGGPVPFGGAQTVYNQRLEDTGWIGSIFGGYQFRCNRWLLGAELNVDWRGYEEGNDFVFEDASGIAGLGALIDEAIPDPRPWAAGVKLERDWVVGLTGRMGYELAPYLLPYIRLGAEWSRDELQFVGARQSGAIPLSAVTVAGSEHKNSYRLVAGIGLEVPVPTIAGINGITVRAEYDYHSRGQTVGVTTAASDNVTLVNSSMNPTEQSAIVSLVWNI